MGRTSSALSPSSPSPSDAFGMIPPLEDDDNDDDDDDDEDANIKIGKNDNRLRICRTKLRTDAIGGPSVLYIPRSVTLRVPYRNDTRSSNIRPRSLIDGDDSLSSISPIAHPSPMQTSSTSSTSSFVIPPPRLPTTAHRYVDVDVIRRRSTVTPAPEHTRGASHEEMLVIAISDPWRDDPRPRRRIRPSRPLLCHDDDDDDDSGGGGGGGADANAHADDDAGCNVARSTSGDSIVHRDIVGDNNIMIVNIFGDTRLLAVVVLMFDVHGVPAISNYIDRISYLPYFLDCLFPEQTRRTGGD